mmetsp:Transcript_106332/g.317795  ORF Transcript_106332/g.317795 Transcript_106332/m.317795 type:complete len:215 (+) Transcript_106332:1035-1679(+)
MCNCCQWWRKQRWNRRGSQVSAGLHMSHSLKTRHVYTMHWTQVSSKPSPMVGRTSESFRHTSQSHSSARDPTEAKKSSHVGPRGGAGSPISSLSSMLHMLRSSLSRTACTVSPESTLLSPRPISSSTLPTSLQMLVRSRPAVQQPSSARTSRWLRSGASPRSQCTSCAGTPVLCIHRPRSVGRELFRCRSPGLCPSSSVCAAQTPPCFRLCHRK